MWHYLDTLWQFRNLVLLLNDAFLLGLEFVRMRIEQTIFHYWVDHAHHFSTEFLYTCSCERDHITSITITVSILRDVGARWEIGGGGANCCGVRVTHLFCVVLCLCVLLVFVLCLVCPVSLECPFLVFPLAFSSVAPFSLFRFSYIAWHFYFPVHSESPSDTAVLPANRVEGTTYIIKTISFVLLVNVTISKLLSSI